MRRLFVIAATALLTATAVAADRSVTLALGGSQSVTVERKMATIYVSDPAIVTVSARDGTHIALTGRRGGHALIVAVDEKGKTIMAADVTVRKGVSQAASGETLTLQRGTERITYACAGNGCKISSRSGKAAEATMPVVPPFQMPPIAAPSFAPVAAAMPVGVMPGG